MAKNAGDVILRDRMQFELDVNGDLSTLYGRVDLSDYVNTVDRKGLSVKEVRFHLRDPNDVSTDATNTGILSPVFEDYNLSQTGNLSAVKLFATTRAYENAKDVGIASPDVICVEEYLQVLPPMGSDIVVGTQSYNLMVNRYGTPDLHPEGFTVVSDLLIGIAADALRDYADGTLELDVMIIASPVTVTTSRMNEILTQAQDL